MRKPWPRDPVLVQAVTLHPRRFENQLVFEKTRRLTVKFGQQPRQAAIVRQRPTLRGEIEHRVKRLERARAGFDIRLPPTPQVAGVDQVRPPEQDFGLV
jgi:hypothetical protein